MRVLIITIALGKYTDFLTRFINTCNEFFVTDCEKEFLVITDKNLQDLELPDSKIHSFYNEKLFWPLDTMMRFNFFIKNSELISKFDYVFYLDSDMYFNMNISKEEVIPYEEGFVGVQHPGFHNNNEGSFERNYFSTAYVPNNHTSPYFQGCFIGGKSEKFIEMSNFLNNQIEEDFKKNYIAVWHDESHLNKFFYLNKPKVVHPGYAYPEMYDIPGLCNPLIIGNFNFEKKIVHIYKNNEEIRK